MRLAIVLIAAVVAATMLSGCAPTVTGSTPERTISELVDPPANQLVLQIDIGTGYLQQDYAAVERPELTLYGSGRAYVVADRAAGSRFTPVELTAGSVSLSDRRDLLEAAQATGLFGDEKVDLGDPGITDAASTRVTLQLQGGPVRSVSAYALQYTEHDGDLDRRQREGRRALRALISRAERAVVPQTYPAHWTPDRIDVTELQVTTRTADPQPWPAAPLDTVLTGAIGRRCGIVTGAVAGQIYETALVKGNVHWSDGGTVRALAVRALLPGETGCGR